MTSFLLFPLHSWPSSLQPLQKYLSMLQSIEFMNFRIFILKRRRLFQSFPRFVWILIAAQKRLILSFISLSLAIGLWFEFLVVDVLHSYQLYLACMQYTEFHCPLIFSFVSQLSISEKLCDGLLWRVVHYTRGLSSFECHRCTKYTH